MLVALFSHYIETDNKKSQSSLGIAGLMVVLIFQTILAFFAHYIDTDNKGSTSRKGIAG